MAFIARLFSTTLFSSRHPRIWGGPTLLSKGSTALLGAGWARSVTSKTSTKARQAQELKRRLQEKQLRSPPKPTARAPPGAQAAIGAGGPLQGTSTTFRAIVAVTGAIVIGGIAYAWSTLVDLLRKLERIRQEAVSVRAENGGVPPLSAELTSPQAAASASHPVSASEKEASVEAAQRLAAPESPVAAVQEWAARAAERLRAWLAAFRALALEFAVLARDQLAMDIQVVRGQVADLLAAMAAARDKSLEVLREALREAIASSARLGAAGASSGELPTSPHLSAGQLPSS